jgi:hypothetical protein
MARICKYPNPNLEVDRPAAPQVTGVFDSQSQNIMLLTGMRCDTRQACSDDLLGFNAPRNAPSNKLDSSSTAEANGTKRDLGLALELHRMLHQINHTIHG